MEYLTWIFHDTQYKRRSTNKSAYPAKDYEIFLKTSYPAGTALSP